jgi:CheY-specific phosphatase CheX
MHDELNQLLRTVAEETFESLAFMFSMGDESEPGAGAEMAWAGVRFSGPFSGRLTLAVSQRALPALAGNMLGLDDSEAATPDQQHDGLKELANVVCGNLLPKIAGKQALFEIAAPELLAGEASSGGAEQAATAYLTLDEGEARIALFVEGKVPSPVGVAA